MKTTELTADHIERARKFRNEKTPGVCEHCPIALAVREQIHPRMIVGYAVMGLEKEGILFDLPKKAKKFAMLFDAEQPVEPFSFEFNATSQLPE